MTFETSLFVYSQRSHRMDRHNVEPGDGLHKGQPRVSSTVTGQSGSRSGFCSVGKEKYRNGFGLTMHESSLRRATPLADSSILVFVNSMSDLFHPRVTDDFIFRVIDVIRRADIHHFQLLTKRSERMRELARSH